MESFVRTHMLLGDSAMTKLEKAHIALFGLGGVGSFAAEGLIRCGILHFDIFDGDIIDASNINRQIIATSKTIGMAKTEVMKKRMLEINPDAIISSNMCFFSKDNYREYPLDKYDYIIDAIDTVSSKLILISQAERCGVPIISCMGTGNKLSPELLKISDIYKTSVCPLARVMRHELKKLNITKLKVLYSTEKPVTPMFDCTVNENTGESPFRKTHKKTPGSVSFVPSAAGLIIASEVVRDLIG